MGLVAPFHSRAQAWNLKDQPVIPVRKKYSRFVYRDGKLIALLACYLFDIYLQEKRHFYIANIRRPYAVSAMRSRDVFA